MNSEIALALILSGDDPDDAIEDEASNDDVVFSSSNQL